VPRIQTNWHFLARHTFAAKAISALLLILILQKASAQDIGSKKKLLTSLNDCAMGQALAALDRSNKESLPLGHRHFQSSNTWLLISRAFALHAFGMSEHDWNRSYSQHVRERANKGQLTFSWAYRALAACKQIKDKLLRQLDASHSAKE